MKESCRVAHTEGVYTLKHLIPLFLNVLQQLQVTVSYALNLHGDEAVECASLNDAAAPVMAWACDISSLASAPAVAACFHAFASFSRQRCLDTDLVVLFASLKRFGTGTGSGELLNICKEIAAKLTDDGSGTADAVFPATISHFGTDDRREEAEDPERYDAAGSLESEIDLDNELVGVAENEECGSNGCSPLAATPPAALHGASPLLGEDADRQLPPFSNFAPTVPLYASHPSPLYLNASYDGVYQNYNSGTFDSLGPEINRSVMYNGPPQLNVDSAFTEVVSGLNSATAQAVKRAQHRHRARRDGRLEDGELEVTHESDDVEGHSYVPSAPPSHSVGPPSLTFMSETATAETLAANRFFAERLASIESMLYRLTASHGQFLVDQNAESVLQKSHDHTPALSARSHPSSAHVGSPRLSDVGSPLLSARSQQTSFAEMSHGVHQSAQEFSKPKPNRGNTANTAAQAAAKYLKSAAASNAVTANSEAAPVTIFSMLPGARNSAPLALSVVDSQPVDDVASKHSANMPVNRDSLEKAMQAMSGPLFRPPLL
jgi:hypothetical protein